MIDKLLLEVVNRAVQTVLSVDPDSVRELAALTGKVYCIKLTMPPMTLYLLPDPEGFSLTTESETSPDVTLSGSAMAFAKLSGRGATTGKTSVFGDGQITMEGDAEAGQALQRALSRFDLDWEELVARVIGDLPARKVGNAARGFGQWADKTAGYTRTNFSDFLTEEARVMASKVAMQRLEREVSALRSDTDRLGQRIDKLLNQTQTAASK